MQLRLQQIFKSTMRVDYGVKVREMYIMLRVSGELVNFGSEGPERLLHRNKDKYVEIDLVIPRHAWEEQPLDKVRADLVRGMRAAFMMLKSYLADVDDKADLASWERDFDRCIQQFLDEAGAHEGDRKYTLAKTRQAWRERIRRDKAQHECG